MGRAAKVRIWLASGGSNAPRHTWLSERAVEAEHPFKQAGTRLSHLPDGVLELLEDGGWDIKDTSDQVLAHIHMPKGSRTAIEVELNQKTYRRLSKEIFPSLLREYDFVWYFCEEDARKAVYKARADYLKSDAERQRIRIMPLPPTCKPLDKTSPKE